MLPIVSDSGLTIKQESRGTSSFDQLVGEQPSFGWRTYGTGFLFHAPLLMPV